MANQLIMGRECSFGRLSFEEQQAKRERFELVTNRQNEILEGLGHEPSIDEILDAFAQAKIDIDGPDLGELTYELDDA